MSVLLETSLGDIVIDLCIEECPKTCEYFLRLVQMGYYSNSLVQSVDKDFIAKIDTDRDSSSYPIGLLRKEQSTSCKHGRKGSIGLIPFKSIDQVMYQSGGFYLTLREELSYLDESSTVFGYVEEGLDTLDKLNEAYVGEDKRPLRNIRISRIHVLDDPFPGHDNIQVQWDDKDVSNCLFALEENEEIKNYEEEDESTIKRRQAKSRAEVLEIIGDLPDANIKPPESVLFVCKLNACTRSEDLEVIFSRFGTILKCDIVRDWKTGDSLRYGFIEFEDVKACEEAYSKMENVLIDDRRIHVDFSQSVGKLWNEWRYPGRTGDVQRERKHSRDKREIDRSQGRRRERSSSERKSRRNDERRRSSHRSRRRASRSRSHSTRRSSRKSHSPRRRSSRSRSHSRRRRYNNSQSRSRRRSADRENGRSSRHKRRSRSREGTSSRSRRHKSSRRD